MYKYKSSIESHRSKVKKLLESCEILFLKENSWILSLFVVSWRKGLFQERHRLRENNINMIKNQENRKRDMSTKKRKMIDYLLTVPAVVVLAPAMAGISVWIKLDSPGPVFFRQKRVGIHKEYFDILKFRTMRTDTPQNIPTHLLKNPEQYITRSGAFLRKTSLDELPQLFNILKGDMSLVGPRPALWNQYDLIRERDYYGANDVLPGLTGWAQIHGRDTITVKEKAALDGYYVKNSSVWMDIKCILMTALSVLKHEGIVEGGTGTMKEQKKQQEKQPLVSVVLVSYRRDEELKKALHSLEEQSYPNLEIILVDDNANREWNKKLKRIAEEWDKKSRIPLIYIQNPQNLGSAESRNQGIKASSGEYITFLDDDDRYTPQKVEHQLRHMLRTESDFSITDLVLLDEQGKMVEKRTRYYLKHKKNLSDRGKMDGQEEYVFGEKDTKELLANHLMYHLTGTDTLMFRREYLEKIRGFPPINVGDEFYLMNRAFTNGGSFSYLPVSDVKAMVHTHTMGLSSRQSKIDGENVLYEYKKQYFPRMKRTHVRKIRMRHHLVLAYAYLRSKSYGGFFWQGLQAVFSAPFSCMEMVIHHRS